MDVAILMSLSHKLLVDILDILLSASQNGQTLVNGLYILFSLVKKKYVNEPFFATAAIAPLVVVKKNPGSMHFPFANIMNLFRLIFILELSNICWWFLLPTCHRMVCENL